MVFRARWHKRGAHVHVRLFTAEHENSTFALCGNLTFREHEWSKFRLALAHVGAQIMEES